MRPPVYYRAYIFALKLGHNDIASALVLEGEEQGTLVYVEVLSWIVSGADGDVDTAYRMAFARAARKDHFLVMRALLKQGTVDFDLSRALLDAIRGHSVSATITLLAHNTPVDLAAVQQAVDCGSSRISTIMLRELWMRS